MKEEAKNQEQSSGSQRRGRGGIAQESDERKQEVITKPAVSSSSKSRAWSLKEKEIKSESDHCSRMVQIRREEIRREK